MISEIDIRRESCLKTTATIIGLTLFACAALGKDAIAELKVPAMDCAACTVVIKKALTQTKGVKTVDLSVEKRTATVVYDDTQITESQIEKAIEKSGFKTEPGKK